MNPMVRAEFIRHIIQAATESSEAEKNPMIQGLLSQIKNPELLAMLLEAIHTGDLARIEQLALLVSMQSPEETDAAGARTVAATETPEQPAQG